MQTIFKMALLKTEQSAEHKNKLTFLAPVLVLRYDATLTIYATPCCGLMREQDNKCILY